MSECSDVGLISDSHRVKRVWYREPAVLMTITSLLLLCGITTAVQDAMLKKTRYPGVVTPTESLWKLCHSTIPLPGIYLTFLLSDYVGRKPVTIFLFLLSILSSTLHSISLQNSWLLVAFVVQELLKNGTIVMTLIGTWEYSSPKNKLTYMLVNMGVWQMTEYFTKTEFYGAVLEIDYFYMRVITVLLGLVCLGWTLQWPESPHWLATKNKVEESRTAFLWMHGEEEYSLLKAPSENSEEPPKLYGLSVLIVIVTITIYKTTVWYKMYSAANTSTDFISNEFKTGILVCTAIFAVFCTLLFFNKIKQKFVFLTFLGLVAVFYTFGYISEPLVASLYTVGANQILVKMLNSVYVYINNGGPFLLCLCILVKTVSQEYRTFAYALLSYIQIGFAAMVLIFAIIVSNE